MTLPEKTQPASQHEFVIRLLGGIVVGIAILLLLQSVYLATVWIPRVREVLVDFGAQAYAPRITRYVVETHWAAAILSVGAGSTGMIAAVTRRRRWLVSGFLLCLVTAIVLWVDKYAIDRPFTDLVRSISGS
jgi:hypothetical protein